jgi:3'(2'), 5'-bisphosphate nucleotidase
MLDQINVQDIVKVVKDVSKAIMQVYDQDFELKYKKDDSPLTLADKEAHNIIETGLNRLKVRLPILSEEGKGVPYER